MKFISYHIDNQKAIGIINAEGTKVYDLNQLGLPEHFEDMNGFISRTEENEIFRLKELYQNNFEGYSGKLLREVQIQAPISQPVHDILCLGLNYKEHVQETAKGFNQKIELPKYPVYFSKRVHRAIGPHERINGNEAVTTMLDYEVELAVVIGKEGINIPKEEVENYIFGYTIMNDLSARDLQQRHMQWFRGKSLDSFTALGPCIVHKSQLPLPLELKVISKINGEIRQQGNTSDFIFDIPTIIEDLSRGMTLKPGDIIATGTPSGVGMGFNPPRFMKPGDVVECEIEGIGTLKNTVAAW
ncbi:fumarylacetoacetate hydrolase family protein [Alkaliphilus crotonatoxidans]